MYETFGGTTVIYQREKEKKYVVSMPKDLSLADRYDVAKYTLNTLFPDAEILEGVSTDTFWTQKGTDFIRLRRNTSELSVKVTDKATIEDRVEENIVVEDFDTAYRFSTAVFGQPVGTLTKHYYVLTLSTFIIALYTVEDDDRLFLEVEADDISIVTDVAGLLHDHFEMKQELRSLFQIIFGEAA
jgi:hypothetical protein